MGEGQNHAKRTRSLGDLAILALSLVGMAIAAYMWYAYARGGAPLCAPGGGCYELETGPHARLANLPVALWGLLTYASILSATLIGLWVSEGAGVFPRLFIFGAALCGWLFSVYLQGIARFVVGAFCPWCFASALVMTAILALSVRGLGGTQASVG